LERPSTVSPNTLAARPFTSSTRVPISILGGAAEKAGKGSIPVANTPLDDFRKCLRLSLFMVQKISSFGIGPGYLPAN
jgi:hypothetical protein